MAHVSYIPPSCHKSSSPAPSSPPLLKSSPSPSPPLSVHLPDNAALPGHVIRIASVPSTIDSLPRISHFFNDDDEDDDPTTYDHPDDGDSTTGGGGEGSHIDGLAGEYYRMGFVGDDDDDGGLDLSNLRFLASPRYWACAGIMFTLGQAVTAMVMLLSSQESHTEREAGTPLRIWLVGYILGCVTSLPLAAWKLFYCSRREQHQSRHYQHIQHNGRAQHRHQQQQWGRPIDSDHQQHHRQRGMIVFRRGRRRGMRVWMEKLNMSLDLFFAVWFVLGNVWVFGRPSLALQTPSLYRLCVAFLALSSVSYALPFLVCAAFCCCLPCFRRDGGHGDPNCITGASPRAIAALPCSRFEQVGGEFLDSWDEDTSDTESNCGGGGGFISESQHRDHHHRHHQEEEQQRFIHPEDAVCCICLRRYKQDIGIRTLPCSHHFHSQCVDKWLLIKAVCPLCKTCVIASS